MENDEMVAESINIELLNRTLYSIMVTGYAGKNGTKNLALKIVPNINLDK